MAAETKSELLKRVHELENKLEEADETLRAIRSGEVDAVVVAGPEGEQIYTLRGADEAYRMVVENMAEGVLTVTAEGLILFCNQAFATLIGYPPTRVIGAKVTQFCASGDQLVVSALLATYTRAEAQLRVNTATGPLVPVHISASTMLFDGVECICLIVTDLTEQKRNQEIVAAERLARSVLDHAGGALLVVEPSGKIIRASRVAGQLAKCAVLLRQFDEVFCLRVRSDAITESMQIDYTFAEILATIQRHGNLTDLDAIARVPDGQSLDVTVSASLLLGDAAECLGCVVLISDISGYKRAEREIRRLNSELELRVRARTAALEAANKELEAFSGTVAHDLRSPLSGIEGWTQALLKDHGIELNSGARELLDRVRGEARHMSRLIDDLLMIAHIGQVSMTPTAVDLTSVANLISHRLRQANPERELDFVIDPELRGLGDEHLLGVALTNLLDNAVKFTGPRDKARIEFGRTAEFGEPAYYVRDNGVGFDMQQSGMLFGIFQRLHKDSEFPGMGIGLATVKRVIQRHGGRVWADGRAGVGASFYFTLGGGN